MNSLFGGMGDGSINHQISPFGQAGGFHMRCCQGFEVNNYDFTLGALPMKASDSCKIKVSSLMSLDEIFASRWRLSRHPKPETQKTEFRGSEAPYQKVARSRENTRTTEIMRSEIW
jgi:hypothetical protein